MSSRVLLFGGRGARRAGKIFREMRQGAHDRRRRQPAERTERTVAHRDAKVFDIGGGTASGRPLRAGQVGGPLGAYFPENLLDTPLDYEAMAKVDGMLGHGGVVLFDDTVDMARQARFAMEFCADESCGKCTPCRIGSVRGVEVIDKIIAGIDREQNLALLDELCQTMLDGSLCAMGGLTPMPVQSAIKHFPADFDRPTRLEAAE
jgi:formate dehydrogenase iron-sulfur subunit